MRADTNSLMFSDRVLKTQWNRDYFFDKCHNESVRLQYFDPKSTAWANLRDGRKMKLGDWIKLSKEVRFSFNDCPAFASRLTLPIRPRIIPWYSTGLFLLTAQLQWMTSLCPSTLRMTTSNTLNTAAWSKIHSKPTCSLLLTISQGFLAKLVYRSCRNSKWTPHWRLRLKLLDVDDWRTQTMEILWSLRVSLVVSELRLQQLLSRCLFPWCTDSFLHATTFDLLLTQYISMIDILCWSLLQHTTAFWNLETCFLCQLVLLIKSETWMIPSLSLETTSIVLVSISLSRCETTTFHFCLVALIYWIT